MKAGYVLASSMFAVAAAVPAISRDKHVVHEKRSDLNHVNWAKNTAASSTAKIPVRIALKQRNLDKGLDYLLEVSDPKSAKYGKHYSQEEVTALFAPTDEAISKVKEWLVKSGIPAGSIASPKSKGYLDFETTVGQLESVLKTQYHLYSYTKSDHQHLGTDQYSLPSDISEHVDFITPGVLLAKASPVQHHAPKSSILPGPKKAKPIPAPILQKISSKSGGGGVETQYCSNYVTPKCIQALYNIPPGKHSNPKNKLGLYESDDEYYRQQDLGVFFALFDPKIPSSYAPKIDLIDFGTTRPNASNAEGEAALDFDVSVPIIYPQEIELFQAKDNFGPSPTNSSEFLLGIFNTFLDAVDGTYTSFSSHGETGDDKDVDGVTPNEQSGTFTPTNVISFSYGLPEWDYPTSYLQRQCDEFLKLGLQGTSLIFSSGDGGVAGGHGYDCGGDKENIFNPQAPAGCPYVTAVGSTFLPDGSNIGDAEIATSSFASGGGFSNIWPSPSYQADAVSSYFANHNPNIPSYTTINGKIPSRGNGVFNRGGRAYPDIAAIGDNGVIVFEGQAQTSGGTSMSAPIVAAILTRINEERLAAHKPALGFVNPALYQNTTVFNDITIGDQYAYGSGQCAGRGFKAEPGWDPVTGLGTPNYPRLREYLLSI